MPRSEPPVWPKAPAAARQTLDTALALAAGDPAAARAMALPLLGQPALHVEAMVLLIDVCRRLGDVQTAARLAGRAARLAPGSGRARTLAAMTLGEAGQPEQALAQALAAQALTPDDAPALVAVVLAALAAARPLAGLPAAVTLCRCPAHPEATALAVGLLDACAGGPAWGVVWTEERAVVGCLRLASAQPPTIVFAVDGAVLGRTSADSLRPGPVPLADFRFAVPPGLPADAAVEVTLAETGPALFGSPVRLPAAGFEHAPAGAGPVPAAPAVAGPPPGGRRKTAAMRSRPALPETVDVVVPVYKGLAETRACLQAILTAAGTVRPRPVVVSDHSPDPALVAWLRGLAAAGRITLLENATNLGFPATANRGMAHGPDRDVVLVNSDALVFDGWLDRLAAAACAAPDIGTATPFSNNATICSYPAFNADNPLPGDISPAALDRLFAQVNAGRVLDIPTGVGFCLYIRRDCLDDVGAFDAAAFGRGYGEENDFCCRAAQSGWRHVLAADVFVVHAGGVSFGAAKDAALARNLAILAKRHPGYLPLVHDFIRRDPALPLRRAVDLARLACHARGPLLLRLCHGKDGGTARRLADEAVELAAAGYATALLAPADPDTADGPDVGDAAGTRVRLTIDGAPGTPNLVFDLPDEQPALTAALKALCTAGVIIHHFLDLPAGVLDLPQTLGVPHEVRVHDYAWFCPRVTLLDDTGLPCHEPDPAACQRCIDVGEPLENAVPPVGDLLTRSTRLLGAAGRVIAPSQDAARRMARHFPSALLDVVPHAEPAFAPPPVPSWLPWDRRSPLRLAVIGAIGRHKGYDVLLSMARDAARRELPLSFAVAGFTQDDYALFATGRVFVSGRYEEGEAADVVRSLGCQAALFLSVWPETWCYTLTEAWRAGLWAVGFDLGAVGERIAGTGWGWRLPPTLNGRAVNDRLLGLFAHPPAPGGRAG
ncbi:glycosyltransferase [Solidesulfovibrio sp.]